MLGPAVAVVATEIKDKKTVMVLIFIKEKNGNFSVILQYVCRLFIPATVNEVATGKYDDPFQVALFAANTAAD